MRSGSADATVLSESGFVEFWGRLRQEGLAKAREASDKKGSKSVVPEDEEADEAEQVDLRAMAANVDLREVHSVLKSDQRYRVFDVDPDARDTIIREYLETMSAPRQTVHQARA